MALEQKLLLNPLKNHWFTFSITFTCCYRSVWTYSSLRNKKKTARSLHIYLTDDTFRKASWLQCWPWRFHFWKEKHYYQRQYLTISSVNQEGVQHFKIIHNRYKEDVKKSYVPALWNYTVAHVEGWTSTLIVWHLVHVGALASRKAVVADTGSEESVSAAVRAGADPAARLRVPATVGVVVNMGDTVHDTKGSTVSVDRLYVTTSLGV